MNAEEIIAQAALLPPQDRAAIAQSMLDSLAPHANKSDEQWLDIAEQRWQEIKSGSAKLYPAEDVLNELKNRS